MAGVDGWPDLTGLPTGLSVGPVVGSRFGSRGDGAVCRRESQVDAGDRASGAEWGCLEFAAALVRARLLTWPRGFVPLRMAVAARRRASIEEWLESRRSVMVDSSVWIAARRLRRFTPTARMRWTRMAERMYFFARSESRTSATSYQEVSYVPAMKLRSWPLMKKSWRMEWKLGGMGSPVSAELGTRSAELEMRITLRMMKRKNVGGSIEGARSANGPK